MAENGAMNAQQIMQQNMLARAAVVQNSVKMTQQIYSQSVDISQQNVINIGANGIRNAGLLLGFIVEVSGEVTNGATDQATLTPFGVSNLVKQFRYDDLSNYTRIQTSGRHIAMLDSVRNGSVYGGVYDPQVPIGYADNFDALEGPPTIAAAATADLRAMYYLPVSYGQDDLRGAIYMGTVSAASNLQITLQDAPFTGTGNPVEKVYSGNANGAWTDNVTVTVYQVYLDQIPRMPDGTLILPTQDLNTVYDLKETTFSGMTEGQDFPMAYSNFRAFLSTIVLFDNGGTLSGGSDVNYWSLASANFTNIFKVSPKIAALNARQEIKADMPLGTYLFPSRATPINTINFGNMELNLNASSVNANARAIVSYEAFAKTSQLKGASSLGGG